MPAPGDPGDPGVRRAADAVLGDPARIATPSHLTSTFHAMFGLTPSRLLETGVAIRDLSGGL